MMKLHFPFDLLIEKKICVFVWEKDALGDCEGDI